MYFLFEQRDSDGNDCHVTDLIVEADDLDAARKKISVFLDEQWPASKTDGGYGNYHPCDCHCEHQSIGFCEKAECERRQERLECEHGGVTIDADSADIQSFGEYEEARRACSIWHSKVFIDRDGSIR